MTSQLIILNRYGVAVASDSLATITSDENDILGHVNAEKIFALAEPHKVLLLNSDSGEISGSPIGVVFALWQKQLPIEPLPTVWSYLDNFIDYLQDSDLSIYPDSNTEFRTFIYDQLGPISEAMAQKFGGFRPFTEETKNEFLSNPKFAASYRQVLSRKISTFIKELESLKPQEFRGNEASIEMEETYHKETIVALGAEAMIDAWFPDEVIASATKKKLKAKMYLVLNRVPVSRDPSVCRITFVGFGGTEPYPCVWELGVTSKFGSVVRWRALGKSNLEASRSDIYFMAQTSTIRNFLYGVHPDFLLDLSQSVPKVVAEDAYESYENPDEFDSDAAETWRGIGANIHAKLQKHMEEFQALKFKDFKTKLEFMEVSDLASVAESLLRIEILAAENQSGPMTVGGKIAVATVNQNSGVNWVNTRS
jgi:hypothetical protein